MNNMYKSFILGCIVILFTFGGEKLYILYSQASNVEHTDGQITGFDKQASQVCHSASDHILMSHSHIASTAYHVFRFCFSSLIRELVAFLCSASQVL